MAADLVCKLDWLKGLLRRWNPQILLLDGGETGAAWGNGIGHHLQGLQEEDWSGRPSDQFSPQVSAFYDWHISTCTTRTKVPVSFLKNSLKVKLNCCRVNDSLVRLRIRRCQISFVTLTRKHLVHVIQWKALIRRAAVNNTTNITVPDFSTFPFRSIKCKGFIWGAHVWFQTVPLWIVKWKYNPQSQPTCALSEPIWSIFKDSLNERLFRKSIFAKEPA